MRYFIISIFVFSGLSSCALSTTKAAVEVAPSVAIYHNFYFSDKTQDYVYKAKINAFDTNFGGILIVKKLGDQNHRIVFTTDFGNKIFDFEIGKEGFKTHYAIEQLNKGAVLKIFQRDFETLIKENVVPVKMFRDKENMIYRSILDKRYNHYFVDLETKELQRIVHTTKTKEKIVFSFSSVKGDIAKKIKILHKKLPLTIDLFYLN
ncbi:hypothetical protein [Aquimarina sediminis]|uniref:hypothetical protein n=1 Tax=Aquimarina sediminis TaxID=2070536 RepID=UPI000FFEB936|nr:hypothetical protein [Aquimarina sediminis]